MESIWKSFKALAPWQIFTLLVVLFGAAGATYGGSTSVSNPKLEGLEENQQLIPVKLGDLVNEITTSGNLNFPNRETLDFGSQGTVAEVLVEEGRSVVPGQVLAKLDQSAVASMSQAVAQAEFDVKNAEKTLEEVRAIDPLLLAQGREKVADAEFQLQEAIEALDDAKQPFTQQEIDTQRKLVADTNLLLETAKQALGDLANEHDIEVAEARETRADARLALDAAHQALNDFARFYTQELAAARQKMADAEFALSEAQQSLSDLPRLYSSELALARQAAADAEVALGQSREALADYRQDYNLELAAARDAVAKGEAALDAAEQALIDFDQDIYGKQLSVEFVSKLRDQEKFSGLDELIEKINQDVADCRSILEDDRGN